MCNWDKRLSSGRSREGSRRTKRSPGCHLRSPSVGNPQKRPEGENQRDWHAGTSSGSCGRATGTVVRSSTAQATHLVDIMDEDRDTRCHAGWQQPCVPWPGDRRRSICCIQGQQVTAFPVAAATNHHELGGLKQHECAPSRPHSCGSRKPET